MDLKHLKSVSISNRLHIGLGLIIAFMAVLTLTGVWGLGTMNAKLEGILQVNERKIELAQNIKTAIGDVEKSFMATLLMKDEAVTKKEQQIAEEAQAAYGGSLATLEKLEDTEKGKTIVADIKTNFEIARNALARAGESAKTGGEQASAMLAAGARGVIAESAKSAGEMVTYQKGQAEMMAKEARATYVKTRYFLLILGAAVFVFAIFLSSFLAKSITGPLSEGVLVAQKIAAGDLTVHIDATASDEVGQLSGRDEKHDREPSAHYRRGEGRIGQYDRGEPTTQFKLRADVEERGRSGRQGITGCDGFRRNIADHTGCREKYVKH